MRHMLSTLISIMAVAALAACGSKAKPEAAEPTTETMNVESDEGSEAPVAETQPEPAPESAASAQLQDIIYFEFDSSSLSDEARKALDENYAWLKENEARILTIEGHTDEKGTDEYNLGLGERRARAARDYLMRLGIDESRIKVITYGEERPASAVDAQNRRSVFVATKKS